VGWSLLVTAMCEIWGDPGIVMAFMVWALGVGFDD
jgi:hypothetical protein